MGRVTVVGLGPAGAELVTAQTAEQIAAHQRRFLRTRRHPSAAVVGQAESFDRCYETAADYDEVYSQICERLIDAASEGDVLYAVPGSPRVLERSVELLERQAADRRSATGGGDRHVEVRVLAAMSFLELAWDRLNIDPVQQGVRLVDGQRFATEAAGQAGPLLVANCHSAWVLSQMKLAVDGAAHSPPVVVLQHLGLPDESIRRVGWDDLDRIDGIDHLTSVYVPELAEPVAAELVRFDELVRTLREQCPWDREQTHASLRRHLLEEAYETLEAIDERRDLDDDHPDDRLDGHLCEELGDLLFQVWIQARLASERGSFTIAEVARGVHDKLVARHPHVFGDAVAENVDSLRADWELRKKHEKNRASVMDGIPATLPALLRAVKILKRAQAGGLAPDAPEPDTAGFERLAARVEALRAEPDEQRLGEAILEAVDLARVLRLDPEDALRTATRRAEQKFRLAEDA